MKKAEGYLQKQEGVEHVITLVGGGQIRFLLTIVVDHGKVESIR